MKAPIDLAEVQKVQFSPEAINLCRVLIKTDRADLSIERFFAELRSFYERGDLVGAYLFGEVWFGFHKLNLSAMVRYARDNRSREDLRPLLTWLNDSLLRTTDQNDVSQVRSEAARQWVASYSILDDIVEALE